MEPRDVAVGATVGAVVGLGLWPPGAVYLGGLAGVLGDGPTLALVAAVAGGVGGTVGVSSRVRATGFAAGVGLVYAAGMASLAATVGPDSPAHLVWYGALAACLAAGAAVGSRARL